MFVVRSGWPPIFLFIVTVKGTSQVLDLRLNPFCFDLF